MPIPHRRSVGLVDVARLAGVSPSTVSGIFRHPTEGYSATPETRAKVLEAAQRLGYRPNGLARAMRRQRFQQVGFLVLKHQLAFNVMPESLVGVFDATTAANNHLVLIGIDAGFNASTDVLPQSFQEECIDCLVVDGTLGFTTELARVLQGSRFSAVYLNLAMPFNAVYVNDPAAARAATLHLLKKGHEKTAFFSLERPLRNAHYSFEARRSAYFKTMSEAGLAAREVSLPVEKGGDEAMAEFLRSKDRPRALVCYHDLDAVAVQRVALQLGLRFPSDLDLVSFNGARAASLAPVPLTTMKIPWYEMGKASVRMALDLVNHPERAQISSTVFDATLVENFAGDGAVL